ncbi:DUF4169 family protein [Sphingomonas sp. UV9]|uniref:DUF4169 family protein n=1 Tax=Sphingomonas sp. UV9 TaxID=1851410 RepID=UPI000FFB82DB|nr:DUF4169 family protein [Sphingomonas sp. UV9]RXD03225.1 DUF4169 family protein [Sphingomonas sp. UV9]
MGEVINLRLARKQRNRVASAVQADQNRRLFGRTAAEKAAEARVRERVEKTLDGARLEAGPSDDTSG